MRSDLIITRILAGLIFVSYICCVHYLIHMQRNHKSASKESSFSSQKELSDGQLSMEASLFNTMETKDLKENADYYVTSAGDVYSKFWHNSNVTKKLTPRVTKKGYLTVHFYVNRKEVTRPIHQLVAESFIPNPLSLPQVNHKDLNKRNNNKGNLEWCTNAENKEHAVRNGAIARGITHGFAKFTDEQIRNIRSMFNNGLTYGKLAGMYNVDRKTMYEIVYRQTWKHII